MGVNRRTMSRFSCNCSSESIPLTIVATGRVSTYRKASSTVRIFCLIGSALPQRVFMAMGAMLR